FEGRFEILGGLEARGFIMAGGASLLSGAGVLPVRKAGKLPRRVITETYELEYGVASLEVHEDQLPEGSRVLVIDDVL
ncbi:adenine phosphoribosyltransferase, partial [Rhizobium johnstonii]